MNSRSYHRTQNGAVNSRAELVSTTKQSGATLRSRTSRRVWLLGVTLAALICAIGLTGCGPPLTLQVVDSNVAEGHIAIEGGECSLTVDVSGLSNGYKIGIGMFTTGSQGAVLLGVLTANSAGVINDGMVNYASNASLGGYYSNVNVGLYDVTPATVTLANPYGWQIDSAAYTSVPVDIKVCLATGI